MNFIYIVLLVVALILIYNWEKGLDKKKEKPHGNWKQKLQSQGIPLNHYEKARHEFFNHNLQKTISLLTKGIEANDTGNGYPLYQYFNLRAAAYVELHDFEKAYHDYSKSISLFPDRNLNESYHFRQLLIDNTGIGG